jgi:hypothetical protein
VIESISAWNEASMMFGADADREPAVAVAVAALDQHARDRAGAAVEDTHLEVDQFEDPMIDW